MHIEVLLLLYPNWPLTTVYSARLEMRASIGDALVHPIGRLLEAAWPCRWDKKLFIKMYSARVSESWFPLLYPLNVALR